MSSRLYRHFRKSSGARNSHGTGGKKKAAILYCQRLLLAEIIWWGSSPRQSIGSSICFRCPFASIISARQSGTQEEENFTMNTYCEKEYLPPRVAKLANVRHMACGLATASSATQTPPSKSSVCNSGWSWRSSLRLTTCWKNKIWSQFYIITNFRHEYWFVKHFMSRAYFYNKKSNQKKYQDYWGESPEKYTKKLEVI